MKITLPSNNFGAFIMLLVILLTIIVPFVVVLWAVTFIAPWWVAVPCSLLASVISFVYFVKFKQ